MIKSPIAYLDEFGNHDLEINKDGVSSHFIITAVIIDDHNLNNVVDGVRNIQAKYFQGSEIKSLKVASDDARRARILKEMALLDFKIFTIVVDKTLLISEGYKYKPVFYKNLPRIILNELISSFPDIKIFADEHGSKEFMRSFVDYLKNQFKPDLFKSYEFYFVESKQELLVQLADFITGSIARRFDKTVFSPNSEQFLEILRSQIIDIREWPYQRTEPYSFQKDIFDITYDKNIANYTVNIVRNYINQHSSSKSQTIQDHISFLKFLLFNLYYIDPNKYISTREIINNLNVGRDSEIKIQYFRSLVQRLRDRYILIASNGVGYKIPTCHSDLFQFVKHYNHYIQPMLTRLKNCRNGILLVTNKELDILISPEFDELKKYFDGK